MTGDIVQMGAYIGAGLACIGMGGAALGVGNVVVARKVCARMSLCRQGCMLCGRTGGRTRVRDTLW